MGRKIHLPLLLFSILATTCVPQKPPTQEKGTQTEKEDSIPNADTSSSPRSHNNENHTQYNHSIHVICNDQSNNVENIKPKIITAVGPLEMKCIFQKPIHWDVFFEPKLNVTEGHLPYEVQSEYKSCPSSAGENKHFNLKRYYFEITLKFNANHMDQNFAQLVIECSSILNLTTPAAIWLVNNTSPGNFDLVQGEKGQGDRFENHFASKRFSRELELGSDDSRTSYVCFNTKNTVPGRRQVKYLNCTNYDWSNCQQLVAHEFKNILHGHYCDCHQGTCQNLMLLSSESVAIYCNTNESDNETIIFYTHLLNVSHQEPDQKIHVIMDDYNTDQVPLNLFVSVIYKYKITSTGKEKDEANNEDQNLEEDKVVFTCSAPKFLALTKFEWTVVYHSDKGSNVTHGKKATKNCEHKDINRNHQNMIRENIICKIPQGYSEIDVTCTVYLQSGKSISMSSYKKYSSTDYPSNSGNNNWVQMALIAVMGLCLVILLPYLCCKVLRQQKQLDFSADEEERFRKGAIVIKKSGQNQISPDILPYDMKLETPREKITVIESELLGIGAFGKVVKGRVENIFVAIKTINSGADGQYFRALLSELKIMSYVGKHANIVELVGANTEKIRKHDVYLIYEFCENGNVLEYIRARRDVFVDQFINTETSRNSTSIRESEISLAQKLCTEDLIRWSMEIASGMNFIASRNVYHGDLAARNILLTCNLVAKVGDFGLARELKHYSLYVQKLGCPLPLKWMAIESLRDLEFSIQSDVWSYGVTLWEMFSLGSTPYPGVEWNFQAWKRLMDGERMDKASNAPQSIHDILLKCWQTLPKDRPNFGELEKMLGEELTKMAVVVV